MSSTAARQLTGWLGRLLKKIAEFLPRLASFSDLQVRSSEPRFGNDTKEFEIAFPKVIGWIEQTLWTHRAETRPVISKNFKRLPLYFTRTQIEGAKFVVVDRVPMPPLSSIGLSRFGEFERGDYDGITYLDILFEKIGSGRRDAALS